MFDMRFKHLLLSHGILKEFSIRKVITHKQFERMCNSISKTCKTQKEFETKFNEKCSHIDISKIPGSIPETPGDKLNDQYNKITHEILMFLIENKLNEEDLYKIFNALNYAFSNKEMPYFRFFNDDGSPLEDEDRDDGDDFIH